MTTGRINQVSTLREQARDARVVKPAALVLVAPKCEVKPKSCEAPKRPPGFPVSVHAASKAHGVNGWKDLPMLLGADATKSILIVYIQSRQR